MIFRRLLRWGLREMAAVVVVAVRGVIFVAWGAVAYSYDVIFHNDAERYAGAL